MEKIETQMPQTTCPACGDTLYETNWNTDWYIRYCIHFGCPKFRRPYHPGRAKGLLERHKPPILAGRPILARPARPRKVVNV